MRQVKITDLPQAGPLTGDELSLIVQSGVSKKASVSEIISYAGSTVEHWAEVAESAANASQGSASAASGSAGTAGAAATQAVAAAAQANNSANAAANSASTSANAANTATAQAGLATTAKTQAESAAQAAQASAISSELWASNAYSYADAASASADAAAAAYKSFDERYLGPKLTDPTTDNYGHVLVVGALYWNIPDGVMKAWTGSSWTAVSTTPGYYMVASNNLSDLTDFSVARTNLGVPSLTGTGASGTWSIGITGNAATVTNGVYTTGSYSDPSWLTALATIKLTGTIANAQLENSSLTINGNLISLGGSTTITAVNPFALTIGSGLSGTSYNGSSAVTITNTAPDQIVSLTASTGIATSGTYPNFTITNTAPDQVVSLTAGNGITISGTYPSFTVTNSKPDQTVTLTGGGTTTVTGTYPNFTISSSDQYSGTVTSVATGTGLTGGPITTSGTISFSNTAIGTWAATPSSANLAAAITDETGSGSLVFANGPSLSAVNIDGASPYAQFSDGTAVALAAGRMWYNGTTGSWNLGMGNGNITQQVGEELFRYGKASAAISDVNLQLVYKTGVVGASGVITFAPVVAGITDPDQIIGVATEPIALNGFGRVTTYGVVNGINTTGSVYGETWADNDDIWYNPNTGGLTKVKPSAPNIKLQIGTVIKAGTGGSGSFIVKFGSSSTLGGTDSNVQFGTLSNADIIQYNSTLGYWTNTTVGSASGIQPYDADLVAIAALTPAANKLIAGTGTTWAAKSATVGILLNDGTTTTQVPITLT